MKAEVDFRPVRDGQPGGPSYYIRLWPETVQEVGELQKASDLGFVPESMEQVNNPGGLHYVVTFVRVEKV